MKNLISGFYQDSEVYIQGHGTLWPMGKGHPIMTP